jgi:tRNA-Thr(GGU) m(6)t(6)A37 methyltransferase TsaA
MNHFEFDTIGIVHSCFKQKFGIPRQSGLIPDAQARLEIIPPYNRPEAFRELEDYSHIWLSFVFHANLRQEWKPMVRPPRLGGNQRVGVFASRSPFRPNPIGLSVVELDHIEITGSQIELYLNGIDLLDGTPVLDIKPYIPYADAIPDARSGYAPDPPGEPVSMIYSQQAEAELNKIDAVEADHLKRLIHKILQQDPRPSYRKGEDTSRLYGMHLLDFNIQWSITGEEITVQAITPK